MRKIKENHIWNFLDLKESLAKGHFFSKKTCLACLFSILTPNPFSDRPEKSEKRQNGVNFQKIRKNDEKDRENPGRASFSFFSFFFRIFRKLTPFGLFSVFSGLSENGSRKPKLWPGLGMPAQAW